MSDSPVRRPVFEALCKCARDRGLYVEVTLGAARLENRKGEMDPAVAGCFLGKVLVTRGGKSNVLVDRTVVNDDIEEAATGCLAFLDGMVP